jgi:hypothetical protein
MCTNSNTWIALGIGCENLAFVVKDDSQRYFAEAIDAFTKAIQTQKNLPDSYIHRGRCRYRSVEQKSGKLAELKRASDDLKTALGKAKAKSPERADTRYWLALVALLQADEYNQQEKLPDAVRTYQEALPATVEADLKECPTDRRGKLLGAYLQLLSWRGCRIVEAKWFDAKRFSLWKLALQREPLEVACREMEQAVKLAESYPATPVSAADLLPVYAGSGLANYLASREPALKIRYDLTLAATHLEKARGLDKALAAPQHWLWCYVLAMLYESKYRADALACIDEALKAANQHGAAGDVKETLHKFKVKLQGN